MQENSRYKISLYEQYKELIKKIAFTLSLLGIFQIISYIVLPGVDLEILSNIVKSSSILKSLDLYSGGSIEKCGILSLGVSPYIQASIIIQLLSSKFGGIDAFMKLKEEGELGRQKLAEYTQYFSLIIAIIYSIMYCVYTAYQVSNGIPVVFIHKGLFLAIGIPALVTGSLFTSWLGGLIQKHGIGSGVSVIMCSNIILGLPKTIKAIMSNYVDYSSLKIIVPLAIFLLAIFLFIICLEKTVRNVNIKYTSQGNQIYKLPIKFDNPGIMTTMFAGQVSFAPSMVLSLLISGGVESSLLKKLVDYLQPDGYLMNVVQALLIMYFAFVCSEFSFNPEENAKNLHESGAIIPGIRPGEQTAKFFGGIVDRINYLTGLYLAIVCVLFDVISKKYNLNIRGSSMLIMIGTLMEVLRQSYGYFLTKQQYSLMNSMNKPSI
jgi:preprotein translocase subunit SecY